MRTNESCLFCHLFLSVLLVLKGFCQGNEFFNDNKGPLLPESYKIGWMEAIDDHKLISGITIPGTHDTMALHGGPVAECQAWDLEDQLKAGVRYLDLRIVAIENKLYLVHWVIYQHKTFIEVLKTVKAFLSTFKSETVVIRVKPELFSQNSVEMLIREIINDDKVVWVNSNMPTMGKARGKVVFVQAPGFKVGVPLLETDNEGNYEVRHIADKEKMIEQHLTQASSQCGEDSFTLSHSSGTGVGTFFGMFLTPKKVAEEINPWLYQYLKRFSRDKPRVCFGVLVMDFPGVDLIQTIIKLNHWCAYS